MRRTCALSLDRALRILTVCEYEAAVGLDPVVIKKAVDVLASNTTGRLGWTGGVVPVQGATAAESGVGMTVVRNWRMCSLTYASGPVHDQRYLHMRYCYNLPSLAPYSISQLGDRTRADYTCEFRYFCVVSFGLMFILVVLVLRSFDDSCMEVDDDPLLDSEPLPLRYCDVLSEIPASWNLSAAEYLTLGVGLRRLHAVGWFYYRRLKDDAKTPSVWFRPAPGVTFTASSLQKVLAEYPHEATAELQAMVAYYQYAEGMCCYWVFSVFVVSWDVLGVSGGQVGDALRLEQFILREKSSTLPYSVPIQGSPGFI